MEQYILERTIETENCIVRVHRPMIDEAERQRRMRQIRMAAENLLKTVRT